MARNVTREVRQAMRPQYPWRPYVLRAYFDTQLLWAESAGKVPHAYRAFWMGHKGDIEARYTTHKRRLPPSMIEDMRLRFKEAEQFLGTTETHVTDVREMLLQAWREQARAYGIDPMRVRVEMHPGGEPTPDQEIQALTAAIARRAAPQTTAPARQTKIVKGDEALVEHMNRGWTLAANLGSGKYLIPSHPGLVLFAQEPGEAVDERLRALVSFLRRPAGCVPWRRSSGAAAWPPGPRRSP